MFRIISIYRLAQKGRSWYFYKHSLNSIFQLVMKKISILGAGWLGTPLALKLKENGHLLKVSTTTQEKLVFFEENNIESFLISIGENPDYDNLDQSLESDYIEKIKQVIPFIEKHKIKEVIYTSSTTVYLSLKGEVNEETPIVPVSEMDRQIVEIENLLLNNLNFNASILRLGGLIGEDRHPVQFIVKRPIVEDANNPVNMVQRNDIIRFVEKMLEQTLPNEVFNIVAPVKLNRRDFYTREAQKLNLSPLPKFVDNPNADLRKVSGEKISKRYGLEYLYLVD